jgi:hypothetical protein
MRRSMTALRSFPRILERRSRGERMRLWDFLFYAAFALVVVSFVRVPGVLRTFAYLIVPAVCAVMLAERWLARLAVGWRGWGRSKHHRLGGIVRAGPSNWRGDRLCLRPNPGPRFRLLRSMAPERLTQ